MDLDGAPCIFQVSIQEKFDRLVCSTHGLIRKEIDVLNKLSREQLTPTCCIVSLLNRTNALVIPTGY